MIYSISLLIILFIVIWVMHKPFNIHAAKPGLNKFHEILEFVLIIQFMIILNELFKRL